MVKQGARCISHWNTHSTPHQGSSSGQPARHTGLYASRRHRTMNPHLNIMSTSGTKS